MSATRTVEQTIAELKDVLKGLTNIGDRMTAVENQLAEAMAINKANPKYKLPILARDTDAGREMMFKGIYEGMPKEKALKVINLAASSPVKNDEMMAEWHYWNDRRKILAGYLKLSPSDLECHHEYMSFMEKTGLGKVLSVAGSPDNFVPEGWSSEILTYYQQELLVVTLFEVFPMTQDPQHWPFLGTGFTAYLRGEPTNDPASKVRRTSPSQSQITFTTKEIAARLILSTKLREDMLESFIPVLRQELIPRTLAEGVEQYFVNGDSAATHMDTAVTDSDDVRKAGLGLRAIAADESAEYDVTTGSTVFAFADFSNVLQKQVKFAARPQEGAWVMSTTSYLKALAFDEVETQDVHPLPTNVNGVINVILARPVVVSPQYPETMNSSGRDTGSGSNTGFLHVNRRQFRVGTRREETIEQDRDIETGQDIMVITTRLVLQQMLPTGNKTVGAGINV